MTITLPVESYKGVDGCSLSETRCSQIVLIYEMLEDLGTRMVTYVEIQEEAERRRLMGINNERSGIRTIFPLLHKIGFVNYAGSIPANTCFTELGRVFVFACRSLGNITNDTPNKDDVKLKLQHIKCCVQRQGLIKMNHNPDLRQHNMWIALRLLKELKTIHWNEFYYTLYCLSKGESIEKVFSDIRDNKNAIDSAIFLNESGNIMPNTGYCYIRNYLEESLLISNISQNESILLDDAETLFTQISL